MWVTLKNLPKGMETTEPMIILEKKSMEDIEGNLYKERYEMAADIERLSAEVYNKFINCIHFKEFPVWDSRGP